MSDFYCDEVLTGGTPVEVVASTPTVLAFRHTRPAYPVHVVVVPKRHVPSLLEADDALIVELLAVVRQVAADVLQREGSCRVVTNLGDYQDSKHLHWHVVSGPRL